MHHLSRVVFILIITLVAHQQLAAQTYRAALLREDGIAIPFTLQQSKNLWSIINATDTIHMKDVQLDSDSTIVSFPVYESWLKFKTVNNQLRGWWYKAGAAGTAKMKLVAKVSAFKFGSVSKSNSRISGRYKIDFAGDKTHSVGEFSGSKVVMGTIMQSTGDLGFFDGGVRGDSVLLSSFDGVHALLMRGKMTRGGMQATGQMFSRNSPPVNWTAQKDAGIELDYSGVQMQVKPGSDSMLNFRFEDLQGKLVGNRDSQFLNKVVIVQLLGTWCPNCLDETNFLVPFYNRYKDSGVAIIGLAYEYTTDKERSLNNLKKMVDRLHVPYPVLWTGVSVGDKNSIEKTLPQLTPIRTFPTTIILNRQGKVHRIDTDFNGPATGEHFLKYKKDFEETIRALLK